LRHRGDALRDALAGGHRAAEARFLAARAAW
jgi:hypothetical protein